MSDGPAIPRLLATLLGVEVERAAPRAPQPGAAERPRPGSARSASGAGLPTSSAPSGAAAADARAAAVRRPTDGAPPGRTRRPPEGEQTQSARRPVAAGRDAHPTPASTGPTVGVVLRRLLAAPGALRATVVAAEVLGPPRALRPYGAD